MCCFYLHGSTLPPWRMKEHSFRKTSNLSKPQVTIPGRKIFKKTWHCWRWQWQPGQRTQYSDHATCWTSQGSHPGRQDFALLQNVQRASGAQPSLLFRGYRVSFRGGKAATFWSWPHPPSAEVKNKWSSPPPIRLHGEVRVKGACLQRLCETCLILRRIQLNSAINVHRSSHKAPIILLEFRKIWFFSADFRKNFSNIKCHENSSSGSRVVPWRRTDKTQLMVDYRNFANAPKKCCPNVTSVNLWSTVVLTAHRTPANRHAIALRGLSC
jgi:hypothetical protein